MKEKGYAQSYITTLLSTAFVLPSLISLPPLSLPFSFLPSPSHTHTHTHTHTLHSKVSELQSKLHCMDGDLNEKREVILRQTQDLEAANERERKLHTDLQVCQDQQHKLLFQYCSK